MRITSGLRAASTACAAAFALLLTTGGPVLAQASDFKSGDWGSADGGVVVIKANGGYDLAITDESNDKSIFSSGKVVDRKPGPDGTLELTLKAANGADTFVVVVAADGSATLYSMAGGRHKAASLTK